MKTLLCLLAVGVLVGGCAGLDIGNADKNTTPTQAARSADTVRGREVAWGGVIVNAKNLSDKTELEVISYPLDRGNRPLTDESPAGRFIAVQTGYLETADYAPGREITVVGSAVDTRQGKVGEANYVYPVVQAKTLHLWPRETRQTSEPQIHFGFGVGIIR